MLCFLIGTIIIAYTTQMSAKHQIRFDFRFLVYQLAHETHDQDPCPPIAMLYTPIFSDVAIKLPIKVVINLLLTEQISSGTNQIVAPIFLAILIANLALA